MNRSFLITLGMTLEFQNFVDVDLVLSILGHLFEITIAIIALYQLYKKHKHET